MNYMSFTKMVFNVQWQRVTIIYLKQKSIIVLVNYIIKTKSIYQRTFFRLFLDGRS